ncbi:hypothetical protein CEXT_540631 [Caerostris extrusa]|uniref:Uncharacterized protein n=1 Tax=Caerostris extrusa TaxID=172846 RepID=A0AAV4XM74_CAEEX|nr:hypothetical protein CEXT_540631 [Caerostris extrusa]
MPLDATPLDEVFFKPFGLTTRNQKGPFRDPADIAGRTIANGIRCSYLKLPLVKIQFSYSRFWPACYLSLRLFCESIIRSLVFRNDQQMASSQLFPISNQQVFYMPS